MGDSPMSWAKFVIDERAVCVWGADEKENSMFLDGVCSDFFMYEAGVHQRALHEAGDDKQAELHAALALRLSYGMALESLFAFLCAAVQAPHCMFGWLSNYKNSELQNLVARITAEGPVLATKPFRASPVNWTSIASTIFEPLKDNDPEGFAEQVEHFGRAWKIFAHDFGNDVRQREYNAIKHGIRTQASALSLKIGLPGDPEPLYEFDSPFSHRFAFLQKKRKLHFDVKQTTVVLVPERCVAGLVIITLSLHNVFAWLRAALGYEPTFQFKKFNDPEQIFGALDKDRKGIISLNVGFNTQVAESEYASETEILAIYQSDGDEFSGS